MDAGALVVDLAPWPGEAGRLSIEALAAPLHDALGDVTVWELAAGKPGPERSPTKARPSAVVLSGSMAFVRDAPPWLPRLGAAVDEWRRQRVPLLGTCFGHQFLAHHLGGALALYERPRAGLAPLHVLARHDPLLESVRPGAPMMWSHQDRVTRPPPGAVILAGSETCRVEAFRLGDEPVWGVQAHPESNPSLARGGEGRARRRGRLRASPVVSVRHGRGGAHPAQLRPRRRRTLTLKPQRKRRFPGEHRAAAATQREYRAGVPAG